jgi:hypothetical protein
VSTNGHVTQEAITEIRESFNRLRGRLFETIECAGLPKTQEDAFKGLVRKTSYDAQADLESILRGR